jgi:hypothetical protein
LSPQLVEAIPQGRQSVELTATRLTELDLPLDWSQTSLLSAALARISYRVRTSMIRQMPTRLP